MKKAVVLAFMLLPANSMNAQGEFTMQEMLAVAKHIGACGVLQSMSAFQNATKMPGAISFLLVIGLRNRLGLATLHHNT